MEYATRGNLYNHQVSHIRYYIVRQLNDTLVTAGVIRPALE